MCGLFGVVLPRDSATDPRIDLSVLGLFAEERGVDAAGLSTYNDERGWLTRRATGPFTGLVRRASYPALTERVQTALGHTRAATQGGRSLAQASPLAVDGLLGTHNGDLDPDSIPQSPGPWTGDTTDSQLLFAALSTAHRGGRLRLERVVRVLSNVRGRAALAWTDTTRADGRVWLARGGLSPLAVLVDDDGAVWWASNPGWLRGIRPDGEVRLLHEGTIWALTPRRDQVTVQHLASFKPTVRPYDDRISAVWRGFSAADRCDDRTQLRHRVHPAATLTPFAVPS